MKDIHGHQMQYAELSDEDLQKLTDLENQVRQTTSKKEIIILAYETQEEDNLHT